MKLIHTDTPRRTHTHTHTHTHTRLSNSIQLPRQRIWMEKLDRYENGIIVR